MKARDLIRVLEKYTEREVVFHEWTGEKSLFLPVEVAATPTANSKNLICLITGRGLIEPIREVER